MTHFSFLFEHLQKVILFLVWLTHFSFLFLTSFKQLFHTVLFSQFCFLLLLTFHPLFLHTFRASFMSDTFLLFNVFYMSDSRKEASAATWQRQKSHLPGATAVSQPHLVTSFSFYLFLPKLPVHSSTTLLMKHILWHEWPLANHPLVYQLIGTLDRLSSKFQRFHQLAHFDGEVLTPYTLRMPVSPKSHI